MNKTSTDEETTTERRQGKRIRVRDTVRIVGVPDLSCMSAECRAESLPVFEHLVGTYKRVEEFDELGNAWLTFRIRKGPHSGYLEALEASRGRFFMLVTLLYFTLFPPVSPSHLVERVANQPRWAAPAQQTGANDMFPQWSHDGKRIVFTSDRDGDPEIYVMNVDGSNVVRLTHAPGRDAHPFFSSDNTTIVFQSPRANGVDTNIYVMKSDGSKVVPLTNLKGFAGVPTYSPDQKRITFQWRESNNFSDEKKWRICVMNADGSNLRVITPDAANDQVPNWSRDGRRLLFYSDRTGKNQVYTMKLDGSDVRRMINTESNDNAAFWSPDNKRISFTSDRSGNSEIYVMEIGNKMVDRLTNTRATERAGVWSRDGTRIVFSSDGDGPSAIFIMNVDGSNLLRLTGLPRK